MRAFSRRLRASVSIGASLAALAAAATPAFAQEETGNPEPQSAQEAADADGNQIIVTGIRASLQDAMNIKRDAQGVVDAISSEDIGKFPDTNLAESLQRVTGVSIDRSSGEGQYVTVRGFGPQFNLVVVNGRQMPTSNLGDGGAPSTRSFDFANLASEGVAGVEVYKSGRVSLPSGGIGSTINIKLPRPLERPGLKGSIGVKGVYDTSELGDSSVQPEVSGIVSKTFADDTIGILLAGSYQKRKGGQAQFTVGNWRPGYTGAENNWGTLAQPGDPRFANIENRPGPTDVYQVPQNAAYDFFSFTRERINGQAVLQIRPLDNLELSVDYLFSQYTLDSRSNSIGVWFNHNDTSSSWTDGPAAGANFYAERFTAGEGKDLAITGAVAANRNQNNSIGGNLKWDLFDDRLSLVLDGHRSTAESKPTSPYGSNIAVGTAIFGVQSQSVDFTTDMPVLSVAMYPGSEIRASNIRPSGNAFRNAYMRDEINEASFRGRWDFDASFLDSLDFGVTYTDNDVRTAFGVIQNDTWGGTLTAAETPDDLFAERNLAKDLAGMGGDTTGIIPVYYQIDTVALVQLLDTRRGICNAASGNTCLAPYSTDQKIREKTWAPFLQTFHKFDIGAMSADLRLGLRYESTRIKAETLAPSPTGTIWVAANEINLVSPAGTFTTATGEYENWLPAIDLALRPADNIVLRGSYSHTITRPAYGDMGALVINQPLRVGAGGSTANTGNPNLLPYKSKNIDLSAEWYYGDASYFSVGFFNKNVSNFITNVTTQTTLFDLPDPSASAEANAARAAGNTTYADIRAYIAANFPALIDPATGGIRGKAADPKVTFTLGNKVNSEQSARLWGFEFALQHAFWDTGFGAILNYTVVKSDTPYDNTLPWTVAQFAVTGVSDSANAVLFYDKNGLQARVAYNWRDRFLGGYDQDPYYTKPYGQVDASASYEFMPGFTVFAEGINILNADRTGVRRNDNAKFFAAPGYSRYAAGVRYSF